jgi:hypothetical protein
MMKRRQLLVAGGLAVGYPAFGGNELIGGQRGALVPLGASPGNCALLPIEVSQRVVGAPVSELRILRFLPGETATGVQRIDLDLTLPDQYSLPRTIYAWQLRRSTSGAAYASNQVRMRFPLGTSLALTATVRTASGTRVFDASMPSGSLMVLTTARKTTGAPPALLDLRYDPRKGLLMLADGTPRDFDALILQTT